LEGHGREPLFDEVDLTRTVGWFTTIFPVRLELETEDPGEALKSVKEQLRRIPNRGLTYGVLRYLSSDLHVIEQLSALPDADVGFNYLGQYAATHALESSGPERSPRSRRRHLLEINGAIYGGRLRVRWGYSEHHHRGATIERVAGDFMGCLRSLIAHCRSPKAGGFTPSDFAQAKISQQALDKLVAAVNKSERRGS
ncbi:MAG: condensation domain-containing protein, partial [Tepidiformaceae bacterium]